MPHPLDLVVRGLEVEVGDEEDADLGATFERGEVGAFLVQQEGRDIDRYLRVNAGTVLFHRLFLDDAQDMQGRRLDRSDESGAAATRAGDITCLAQRGLQTLARQLHQTEARDLAHLHTRTVKAQRVTQAIFDVALVLLALHIDEVDHDQAAQIAQAQLTCDFVGRFEVGAKSGFLDIATLGRARRIHVDRYQRFGVVDHDRATGGQVDLPRVGGFDLMLDLETGEERYRVAVVLDQGHLVGHHR